MHSECPIVALDSNFKVINKNQMHLQLTGLSTFVFSGKKYFISVLTKKPRDATHVP